MKQDKTVIDDKLNDPATREIIRAYWKAEVEEMDENVYRPLEGKYPSLKGILGEMRKESDPITNLYETNNSLGMLRPLKGMVGMIDGLMDLLGEHDEAFDEIKNMFDKIDPVTELYGQFTPMVKDYYIATADAIKDISSTKGIEPAEVVKNKDYMDEVTRQVFPTREEAQKYFDDTAHTSKEIMDVMKGFFTFMKKTGQATDELLEAAKLFPTEKASDTIRNASAEYNTKELDRIYAPT